MENQDLSAAEVLQRDACLLNLISAEKENCSMLQQHSRFKWAFEGDENSGYFHSSIRYRQRKNCIRGHNLHMRSKKKLRDIFHVCSRSQFLIDLG